MYLLVLSSMFVFNFNFLLLFKLPKTNVLLRDQKYYSYLLKVYNRNWIKKKKNQNLLNYFSSVI